jgi:hypothetical protein
MLAAQVVISPVSQCMQMQNCNKSNCVSEQVAVLAIGILGDRLWSGGLSLGKSGKDVAGICLS